MEINSQADCELVVLSMLSLFDEVRIESNISSFMVTFPYFGQKIALTLCYSHYLTLEVDIGWLENDRLHVFPLWNNEEERWWEEGYSCYKTITTNHLESTVKKMLELMLANGERWINDYQHKMKEKEANQVRLEEVEKRLSQLPVKIIAPTAYELSSCLKLTIPLDQISETFLLAIEKEFGPK